MRDGLDPQDQEEEVTKRYRIPKWDPLALWATRDALTILWVAIVVLAVVVIVAALV